MDLNLDITTGRLLLSQESTAALETLVLSHKATIPIRLRLLQATGVPSAPYEVVALDDIGPGTYTVIVLGARTKRNLAEEGFLFSADDFIADGTGDDLVYEATLNLNTEALDEKFPGTNRITKSLDALLSIQFQNAGNTSREPGIEQWPVHIKRAVITGEEGVPTSGDPPYPTASALAASLAAKADKAAPVFTSVPTSDPASAGAVWSNGGVLMISAG